MPKWKWMIVLAILAALCPASVNAKSKGTLGAISDSLAIGVPTSAFLLSFYNEDIEDTARYAITLAAQELFVEGAKESMAESTLGERPSDRGKERSKGFISSHVSATTAGAIKLCRMYPDNVFVKGFSLLSVGLVGYQRVSDDHHTTLQVGLGVGTAFFFDWLGDSITQWLSGNPENGLMHEKGQEAGKLLFSIEPLLDGTGAMGVFTYSF